MNWITFTNSRPIGVPSSQVTAFLDGILRPQDSVERPARASWRSIRNVTEDETEISIYDYIGAFGVTADDFVRELTAIKSSKITLRINSPGGFVDDGIAIFNAIRRHKATVDVFVDGIAASAASFIAMAGDRVVMSPHSQMMIHDAQGFAMGGPETVEKLLNILNLYSDNIASIYAEKAGGTPEEWRERMRDETWLSDAQAVELGLADQIDGRDPPEDRAETPQASSEPVSDPEPEADTDDVEEEPENEPEPIDYVALFERIAQEAEDELFEPEEVEAQ